MDFVGDCNSCGSSKTVLNIGHRRTQEASRPPASPESHARPRLRESSPLMHEIEWISFVHVLFIFSLVDILTEKKFPILRKYTKRHSIETSSWGAVFNTNSSRIGGWMAWRVPQQSIRSWKRETGNGKRSSVSARNAPPFFQCLTFRKSDWINETARKLKHANGRVSQPRLYWNSNSS